MSASSARQRSGLTTALSNLFPNANAEPRVLIVDVGGGRGRILNELRTARPGLKGQMIVQDLLREIDERSPSQEVRGMAYDVFTPQPIQGSYTSPSLSTFELPRHDRPG